MYKRITGSTDAVLPAGYRITGFAYSCSSAGGNVQFYDDATQGDATHNFCTASVTDAGQSKHFAFPQNGITLERGLSVTFGGTGTLFIYYA